MDFKHIYTTKRVAEEIPVHIQIVLIAMLDTRQRKGEELDYLQVFELSKDQEGNQVIINSQEVPQFKETKVIAKHPVFQSVTTQLYIIDDIKHITLTHPNDR